MVVVPLTVKLPAIVTSLGNPTVIVPELSDTSTSLAVPEKVIVPPKAVAVEFDPSVTVIDEFVSDELGIFDKVLSAPLMVLFVKVCEPVSVATVLSIAKDTSFPLPVVSIPVPPVKVIVSLSRSIDNAPPESA